MTPLVAIARLAQSRADIGAHGLPVLLALASRADETGRCWPAMQTIADDARVSLRTARATVAHLFGELALGRIARQRTEDGRQGSSSYSLDVAAIMRLVAAHPRVQHAPAGKVASMHDVPPGLAPECTERHSRVQVASLQSAPPADKQTHEQAQEQIPPGGALSAAPSAQPLRLELVEIAKAPKASPKSLPRKAAGNAEGVNDVLGAWRKAFVARYQRQPSENLHASTALRLLKAVGTLQRAEAAIKTAIAQNVTALHHVANNPDAYLVEPSRSRRADVRAIAQDGVDPHVELQVFG